MATRSVLDIEIHDEEFKEFAATFEKYQQALAKTPKMWDEAGKSQRSTVLAFQGIAAALLAQSALQAKRLKTLKDEAKVEKESSSYWKDMVRSSREVASNAASIAKSVLSTIGVGAIFSGLLGAGGLFGLSELAGSVGNSRRTALGLGSTIGETRAFGLNYGRIVDAGSVIGGVNNSLLDVSRRSDLYLAGLTEGDLSGKDAAQVSSLLISKLKTRVDQTNPLLYGSLIKEFGYGNLGFTEQDLQRIHGTPVNEIGEYSHAFGRDAKRLNVLDPQAKKFQDFDVQLHRAGEQIENVFIRGVAPLIPALTKFSESVVTTATTLADRLIKSGALDKFAGWIEGFAKDIGTKDFQDNVKTFADDIVILAKTVHGVIQWFGGTNTPHKSGVTSSDSFGTQFSEATALTLQKFGNFAGSLFSGAPNAPGNVWAGVQLNSATTLNAIRQIESNNGRNLLSPKGARGEYQLMPGTARMLGVNPDDPAAARRGAGVLLDRLSNHYNHDMRKAIAAYNWGQGNLDRDIARNGGSWDNHLPKETSDYLVRFLKTYAAKSGSVQVAIQNNTGGNVVVSANQLRGQAFQ